MTKKPGNYRASPYFWFDLTFILVWSRVWQYFSVLEVSQYCPVIVLLYKPACIHQVHTSPIYLVYMWPFCFFLIMNCKAMCDSSTLHASQITLSCIFQKWLLMLKLIFVLNWNINFLLKLLMPISIILKENYYSRHFYTFSVISSNFQPFQPFQAISSNVQLYTAISSHFEQFPAISVIFSNV